MSFLATVSNAAMNMEYRHVFDTVFSFPLVIHIYVYIYIYFKYLSVLCVSYTSVKLEKMPVFVVVQNLETTKMPNNR